MRVRTYDPFRQFDQFLNTAALKTPAVPIDVVRHDDNVQLHFDLPGVDVESIELTVEKRELVLRAERSFTIDDDATMVRSERRHGTFDRRLLLAENLDAEALEADYANGVLVVTIPVIAEAKPRKIEIGSGHAELAV